MEPTVTILVAEDEAMIALDYEHALTDAGFTVIVVASGTKAIRLLNEDSSVQGIVTDIRFAEPPDGWEVGRAARRIDAGIPVVYVSGHAAADWPEKGVPNSIMLEKPFAMAQLVTAIAQLLNDRPPREI
ncbi:response regulator [Sinorhizobium meliloti]|uniref:response regulator n=1 Tax=Rhizobium meliloti TaxID=382 RepID=UPI000FD7A52F|nr:response regulator [Sinorhizobium meliloti]RVP57110.1 response regulator [Sinorhizobium meliloti]